MLSGSCTTYRRFGHIRRNSDKIHRARTNVELDDFSTVFLLVDDLDVVDLLEFENAVVAIEACLDGSRDGLPW